MIKAFVSIILILIASCAPSIDPPELFTNEDTTPGGAATESSPLVITVINVGEGDATLIETPAHKTILIDGGPPGLGREKILPLLHERGVDKLDLIIASHFDEDHIGGIAEVIKGDDGVSGSNDDRIPTNGVLDRGGEIPIKSNSAAEYAEVTTNLRREIDPGEILSFDNGINIVALIANGVLANGEKIDISPDYENAHSIGLLLTFNGFRYFTYGDLPGGGGEAPYTTQDLETPLAKLIGEIDVLHISHHGSNTSTNENLLAALKPEYAIISVGDKNDYWHPHKSVIERLVENSVTVIQTEKGFTSDPSVMINNSDINITSDGKNYEIE